MLENDPASWTNDRCGRRQLQPIWFNNYLFFSPIKCCTQWRLPSSVIHFHLYLLIFLLLQFFNPLIYRLRSLHAVGQTPALIVGGCNATMTKSIHINLLGPPFPFVWLVFIEKTIQLATHSITERNNKQTAIAQSQTRCLIHIESFSNSNRFQTPLASF